MKDDKGDLNKATELLYGLSLQDDFCLDIQQIRGRFGIAPLKIGSEEPFKEITKENSGDFLSAELSLLEKYSIPIAHLTALSDYIRFNKLEKLPQPSVAFIDRYAHEKWEGHIEEWYKDKNEPFVKMLILNADSKADIHKFIDDNWERIQEILIEQGREPKRIRSKGEKNKEIDKLIVRYSKQNVTQMKMALGLTKGTFYKDDLIKKMIKKYHEHEVSDGYIRKVLQKYRSKNYL